jgi:hypothetical protein
MVLLYVAWAKKNNPSLKGRGTRWGAECMHAKENKKWWHHTHATLIEIRKSINHKSNIKIKFRYWISDDKNFETDPTWLYFDKLFYSHFLITVIYFVIARTKLMKCQNKREQLSEQVYISSQTTNMVSEQIRTRVRQMLLL